MARMCLFWLFKELNHVISTALYSKAMTLISCHIEKQSRAGMAAEQCSSGARASLLYCWECRREVAANWGGIFWHIADFSAKQSEFELARAQLFFSWNLKVRCHFFWFLHCPLVAKRGFVAKNNTIYLTFKIKIRF